ncbi:MAG TPA: DUF6624 domain-containing protein [Gemmataceae bacterium]|nr:DUF6624 domain-containing protein [Gemmataceae bacterium]
MLRRTRTAALAFMLAPLLTGPARADDAGPTEPKLRAELLDRAAEDQKARRHLIDLQARPAGQDDGAKKELEAAVQAVQDIDARNTARMKEVVDKYGWPGQSLVGKDGAQQAWLLVQHADRDRDFQKHCQALLAEAVKKGEAAPDQLAYLTDRVRLAEGQKQVFGTQFHEVGGRMEPYPIEDEAGVDQRRKDIGLPSLADYRKMIEDLYKPKTSDKTDKQIASVA